MGGTRVVYADRSAENIPTALPCISIFSSEKLKNSYIDSRGAVLEGTVDDATRRPRIFGRGCFFIFRRRRVDPSANFVPQNLLSYSPT